MPYEPIEAAGRLSANEVELFKSIAQGQVANRQLIERLTGILLEQIGRQNEVLNTLTQRMDALQTQAPEPAPAPRKARPKVKKKTATKTQPRRTKLNNSTGARA